MGKGGHGLEGLPGMERFGSDAARSATLPQTIHWDPALYAHEREAVFERAWIQVGHREQVAAPGAYLTCQVADQGVIVMRGRDRVLRAFYNVCSHRAHELLSSTGHATVITCPYHAWSYDTDGGLRSARGADQLEGFDADACRLRTVGVEIFCNFVFVNLDPAAPPLAQQAAGLEAEVRRFVPMLDRLTHAHRASYDLAANWKVVVENYLECYHCPVAHTSLAGALDLADYRIETHGPYVSQLSGTHEGAEGFYDISNAPVREHCSWWLWPNLCWLQFPGSPNMMVYTNWPIAPERTLQVVDFYLTDSQPTEGEWAHINYMDAVVRQKDKSLVEAVQRGLHSRGYGQGRFMVDPDGRAPWSEHAVHHFETLVRAALGS